MKKLLLFLVVLYPLFANADRVQIDELIYELNLSEKTASVARNDANYEYAGEIIIPNEVIYDNETYIVNSIGRDAFVGWENLTSVTIPNSITTIEDGAFFDCKALTSISIPNSVTNIGNNVFNESGWYKNQDIGVLYLDKWLVGYKGDISSDLVIQDGTIGLARSVFYEHSQLTSVLIPGSVSVISESAFRGCKNITSVEFSSGLTAIKERAFYECTSLASLTIPSSVTSIEKEAFYGCNGLNSINVDKDNTVYDSRGDCNAIIETPTNKMILGCQFTVIPNTVTAIGYNAFRNCGGLTTLTIPDSVTDIEEEAFFGCSGISTLFIPSSVTSIGSGAFNMWTALTSITVDKDNPSYDSRNDCNAIIETATNTIVKGFEKTILPNDLKAIGDMAFANCTNITELDIPESVTSIGLSAFIYCIGLTSIIIPNNVGYIGPFAFGQCLNLKSLTIGEAASFIDYYAFFKMDSLTELICLAKEVPSNKNPDVPLPIFYLTKVENITLYVPEAMLDEYKTTEPWCNFKEIIGFDPTGISKVNMSNNENSPIYNLIGVRLKEPQKGINIIGGKKVIVK